MTGRGQSFARRGIDFVNKNSIHLENIKKGCYIVFSINENGRGKEFQAKRGELFAPFAPPPPPPPPPSAFF